MCSWGTRKISQWSTTSFTLEAVVALWLVPYPQPRPKKTYNASMIFPVEIMISAIKRVYRGNNIIELRWPKRSKVGDNPICISFSIVYYRPITLMSWRSRGNPWGSSLNCAFCLEGVLTRPLSGASQVMKWLEFSRMSIQEIVASINRAPDFISKSIHLGYIGPTWNPMLNSSLIVSRHANLIVTDSML